MVVAYRAHSRNEVTRGSVSWSLGWFSRLVTVGSLGHWSCDALSSFRLMVWLSNRPFTRRVTEFFWGTADEIAIKSRHRHSQRCETLRIGANLQLHQS